MARSNASAKKAGSSFERREADGLARALEDDRIDRQVKVGRADVGDIAGVRVHNQKIVIECKDRGGRFFAAEWVAEAAVERENAGALAGIVIAKRRGVTDPMKQYVICEVGEFVALIRGDRKHLQGEVAE